jgi:hypothetical protein
MENGGCAGACFALLECRSQRKALPSECELLHRFVGCNGMFGRPTQSPLKDLRSTSVSGLAVNARALGIPDPRPSFAAHSSHALVLAPSPSPSGLPSCMARSISHHRITGITVSASRDSRVCSQTVAFHPQHESQPAHVEQLQDLVGITL